jgi:Flp pilus assembly protein TadB
MTGTMASLGALTGAALLLVLRALVPMRIADLALQQAAPPGARNQASDWARRHLVLVGRGQLRLARLLSSLSASDADLAVLGRSREDHLVTAGAHMLLGAALGAGLGIVAGLFSSWQAVLVVVPGSLSGALGGCAVSAYSLRRLAGAERKRFLRALGCWLDLVAMAQAGGMGVESALQSSAEIALDRGFQLLRSALERSRVASISPWQGLSRLGRELGVAQLEEIGSILGLAGTEGARVRATLAAKSASMRRRQLADAQAEANATTERLFLPSIVLMLAFMLFLMYPAAVRLLGVV